MNLPRPTSITLDKHAGELVINWMDGHTCRYPLSHLREACPCVECRGGHANMGREHDPEDILALTPARSYAVTDLELVGNYALQPFWDDGHHTGIYTWDYLHHLCNPAEANS
ncbi:MAG TPA: DUF971 domain-containing protein [Aggregatilineales bacterium]|nr:DUF971 domain-containing protein [Aggregatilineales bacterium]